MVIKLSSLKDEDESDDDDDMIEDYCDFFLLNLVILLNFVNTITLINKTM